MKPETCPTCPGDPGRAPGAYCAPLRCYCGHPACPAYGSWVDVRAAQAKREAEAAQAVLRAAYPPDDRLATLAADRGAAAGRARAAARFAAYQARVGGEIPPDPRVGE